MFHRIKLGRNVELHNTHIVFFKSLRDVMQVTTPSAEMGLGSELLVWYGDATSVPYGTVICWLTCRPEQTNKCVLLQAPDAFKRSFIPRIGWNNLNFWMMNTQSLSILQMFQSFSHKCKNFFLQFCPKEFMRFLCEPIVNILKGKRQSIKKLHLTSFQNEYRLLPLKK